MTDKVTQRQRVLDALTKRGELTTREAVTEMNIMSLPKRVEELRKTGYPITLEWRTSQSGARYGVYKLIQEGM